MGGVSIEYSIRPDGTLASAEGSIGSATITLDPTAQGHGWFIAHQ